jgi:hypothetical protein
MYSGNEKKKLLVIFKRSGQGRTRNLRGENSPCGGEYFPGRTRLDIEKSVKRDRSDLGCRICGPFLSNSTFTGSALGLLLTLRIDMFVEDVERSAPALTGQTT